MRTTRENKAKETGLEPFQGANRVAILGSNHTQEYNLKVCDINASVTQNTLADTRSHRHAGPQLSV